MISIPVHEMVPVLQTSVGPVILISGVGLLLLTLSNRFGRAVDRSRLLGREMRKAGEGDRSRLAAQVDILYRRSRVIRLAIVFAAPSILLASVMIIVLFLSVLADFEAGVAIALLFIFCLGSLVSSMAAFIRDIQLSLKALKLELGRER